LVFILGQPTRKGEAGQHCKAQVGMSNTRKDILLRKPEMVEQLLDHETEIQKLKRTVEAQGKIIQALMSRQAKANYNLRAELQSRALQVEDEAYQRIVGIFKAYVLTPADINGLLDKVATQNKKEPIHNLAGYIYKACAKDFSDKLKDLKGGALV
jgi:hypothetical protein